MPICNYTDCKERATHNYKDEKERLYCKNHKKENMISFDEKTKYCIESECTILAYYNLPNTKKYKIGIAPGSGYEENHKRWKINNWINFIKK